MIGGICRTLSKKTGKPIQLLLLGLEEMNLKKLAEGQPMALSHETHRFVPQGMEICIFAGKDQQDLLQMLRAAGFEIPNVELADGQKVDGKLREARRRSTAMRNAAVIAMPTVLMVAFLYERWVQRGRQGPFSEELRRNTFSLLAFLFSLVMLAIGNR